MDEQVVRYREAKLMEPIYRMFKVIEETDVLKAQTFMSVTMQYIIEHYSGRNLTPADVQAILRAVAVIIERALAACVSCVSRVCHTQSSFGDSIGIQ